MNYIINTFKIFMDVSSKPVLINHKPKNVDLKWLTRSKRSYLEP